MMNKDEIREQEAASEALEKDEVIVDVENQDDEVVEAELEETADDRVAVLEKALEDEKKSYLLLMADFDNYRKRTRAEIQEIIKNAGERIFKDLLPIIDDFERGIKAVDADNENAKAVKDGMELIYSKLIKFLEQNGVKAFDADDIEFDADKHEAISMLAVSDEALKGKIIDTVQKGYMLNDKVLRYAKVVVAQK